jgi:arrestin-related trafficking adapter 1
MPGRLLTLKNFRSSLQNVALKTQSNSSPSLSPSPLSSSSSPNSDHPHGDSMDLLKRHSISLGLGKKERSLKPNISKSPAQDAFRPAKLAFVVESPPLVSFNAPSQSSGALFSGELRLTVLEKSVVFESIVVELISCVSVKKPVAPNCPQCTSVKTTLRKWVFANEPLTLEKGEHKFPVSHLFEGKAPATTHAYLAMLDYEFAAVATTATGETLKFAQTVELNRAIPPGLDKQSVRVFPPTNITANITLNPTVHQIGEFPVVMRMNGMTTRQKDAQVRWRLRRLNWRIEEHQKVFSPACEKHRAKLSDGKAGILHEENRCIGEHEVNYNKNPWKSDPSAGSVETEFVCTSRRAARSCRGRGIVVDCHWLAAKFRGADC